MAEVSVRILDPELPHQPAQVEALQEGPQAHELPGGLLGGPAARLRQEDENEDEPKETDTAVDEEGGGVAKEVLEIPEGLEDEEPAEVGGEVGQGVGPTAGPGKCQDFFFFFKKFIYSVSI